MESVRERIVSDERLYFAVVFTASLAGTYFAASLFFQLVHWLGLWQHKLIRPPAQYPKPELMRKALLETTVQNLIILPLSSYFVVYPILKYTTGDNVLALPQSWQKFLFDLAICIVCEDTSFYWGHRTLHHKSIYKYIHKQHHEFFNSVGWASEYAHPVETILTSFIPPLSGVLLTGNGLYFACFWFFMRVWQTVDAHSGYLFDWSPWNVFASSWQSGTARHDYHHSQNRGCYGSLLTFWDWAMGTDQQFREWQEKSRDVKASAIKVD